MNPFSSFGSLSTYVDHSVARNGNQEKGLSFGKCWVEGKGSRSPEQQREGQLIFTVSLAVQYKRSKGVYKPQRGGEDKSTALFGY